MAKRNRELRGLRGRRAFVLALLAGTLALSRLPVVLGLEEQYGLSALFSLRGQVAAPTEVALVAISRDTAAAYGLPSNLREWPRQLHAELLGILERAGAAVVVFDIAFEEARDPPQDAALAAAIASHGQVLLLERIRGDDIELAGLNLAARQLRQTPALPLLADRALGTGPFVLPRFPLRTSQFWAFGTAGEYTPMLPALAAQAAGGLPQLVALLDGMPGVPETLAAAVIELAEQDRLHAAMRLLRRTFTDDPALVGRALKGLSAALPDEAQRRQIEFLISLYAGPASRYLNFYGPAGTIRTFEFHNLVGTSAGQPDLADLAGRVVFVGFAETEPSAQQDEFTTVYSESTGQSLSGVEIGATAFANLVRGESVVPLSPLLQTALLGAFVLGISCLLACLPLPLALLSAALAAGAYLWAALTAFADSALWLQLVVPLGFALPLAMLGEILLRYRSLARQRELVRLAVGPGIEPDVVERLARETVGQTELVSGACLVSDIAAYTTLSESLPPQELAALMREYFSMLGRVVKAHGGSIADVSGDSMVGVWLAPRGSGDLVAAVVRAALAAAAAVDEFNEARQSTQLPTTFGIANGEFALTQDFASAGPGFRPVGDIVNTASRTQGLNRVLGTRVLVALVEASVPAGRRIGRFRLAGKTQALDVWQPWFRSDEPARQAQPAFDAGVHAFQTGDIAGARAHFAALAQRLPDDGAVEFCLDQCRRQTGAELPPDWDGTIVMETK